MGLLRIGLVAVLLLVGSLCLYAGLGHRVPGHEVLVDYGIPIGIGLFLCSALLASSGWRHEKWRARH
jgi:hypothetical protein